jgi:NAD+ synthase (glutamine-hydrolysing)
MSIRSHSYERLFSIKIRRISKVKIALAQIDVIPNKAELSSMVEEAKAQRVDLIAFPEMCVGGYLLSDKWQEDGYCDKLMAYNEILKASSGIAIAYGNVYLDKFIKEMSQDDRFHPNKDGRTRKYNSVYVIQDGKSVPLGDLTTASSIFE